MSTTLELLKKHWNFSSFRGAQQAVIEAVLEKKDVFVLLPTGAGKSLCYQLPALMNPGICLVISPLIALMEDQVKSLQEKGIGALMLSARLSRDETIRVFDNLRYGHYKLLYLSPEKLASPFIQEKIKELTLNLIAIDEAHCISQWGHDFRPSYLKISMLNEMHPDTPKIALTATATESVSKDIIDILELRNVQTFKGSYYRDNLYLSIQKRDNIRDRMLALVKSVDEPVIIYVGTRKQTHFYQDFLLKKQISSTLYHGGMSHESKSESLSLWKQEKCKVMVATNAFGMGIDKSNVRMIIHAHLPGSIENFVQEIGRAGRDGKDAFTWLLYNEQTLFQASWLIENSTVDAKFCIDVYAKLNEEHYLLIGDFSETIYSTDLQDFSSKYGFQLIQVYHALNHLQLEGILFCEQNSQRQSRVRVVEQSNKLIEIQSGNTPKGRVLQLLLRNYGGITERLTAINESQLAKKMNTGKSEAIRVLQILDYDKVIRYKRSSQTMNIRFLVPREDHFIYHKIKSRIEQRNRVKRKKLDDMKRFIETDHVCRQVQLLRYFGEKQEQPCGKCDVCQQPSGMTSADRQKLAGKIILLLEKAETMSLKDLSSRLEMEEEKLIKTLEILLEKNTIQLNLQNQFYLTQ